mgnify:CR=1 FL=1
MLEKIEENAVFDAVLFTDINGVDYIADGRTADVTERAFFKNGINGVSGSFFSRPARNKRKIIKMTNNPISAASSCMPTRFSSLIMLWVTLFGNVCTSTYLLLGRYVTQILSVLLSESQINAPFPPFSNTPLTPAAVFLSITPSDSNNSTRCSS